MKICLIGDGLISLTLAKTLINNNIKVFLYYKNNKNISNKNRTIGITSSNLDFFQKEILRIKKKLYWEIKQIEIFNYKNNEEKILNFEESEKVLFSIIKNSDLYDLLNKRLEKSNNFKKIKIKDKFFYKKILNNKNYNLIINCDENNEVSKRFFSKKILKNYQSTAYASVIFHNKIKNQKAIQIFTKYGPLAFLPISENQTSVIYSIKNKTINSNLKLSQKEFEKLIFKNNKEYKINSINKFETFILSSKTLRNYHNNNILAFGDMLHKIHPLSGQGFNMTLRDIKVLIRILRDKASLGLPIDYSIYNEFENKTKHLNFIFSFGNDFIYEFFNYHNFLSRPFSKKIIDNLKNNSFFNKLAIQYADKGLII